MKKRFAAAVLWFHAGWVVGALFAFATGLDPVFAPIVAIASAAIIAGDPRRIIWTPSISPRTITAREGSRILA